MAVAIEAFIALKTYYNYVDAWVLALDREYVGPETTEIMVQCRQESLPSFKKMQGGGQYSSQLASEYCRAKLTLIAMDSLPVHNYPELAATANLWLPVQAYYAVQAMGNAIFISSGQEVPNDHRAFCAAFSDSIVRLLPFPFNAICIGGPARKEFTFDGITTSPNEAAAQNQLANPRFSQGHHFIGKSLSTTRERRLKELLDYARRREVKEGQKSRQLPREEQRRIAMRLPNTSIADFLYRMRLRANYDDSDMYLKAFENLAAAVEHYKLLIRLSKTLIDSMNRVITRKIGRNNMERLEKHLPS